jgi:hypothetical protein
MTFMERLAVGDCYADEIDDWVDNWHLTENSVPARVRQPLHEFLGMTIEEYGRWVADPDVLEELARRRNMLRS